MCGVTANNQEGNYQVNDLQLKDNKRAAFVSILRLAFYVTTQIKAEVSCYRAMHGMCFFGFSPASRAEGGSENRVHCVA